MKQKRNDNYLVKIFIIGVFTAFFIVGSWLYVIYESNTYEKSILNFFSMEQESAVKNVVKNIKNTIQYHIDFDDSFTKEIMEEIIVERIIKSLEVSGSRYWFLYSSNKLIFEKDKNTITNLGKTPSEVIKDWKVNGGLNVADYEKLIQNKNGGTVIFSRSNDSGKEIVTIKFFTIEEEDYIIGFSSNQKYLFSISNFSNQKMHLQLYFFIVNIVVLIVSLILCLLIYWYSKKEQRTEVILFDRNTMIENLNMELSDMTKHAKKAAIFDSLTGVYNRRFFDTMISRINEEIFLPVSIIVLSINGLDSIKKTYSYTERDKMLIKATSIIKNNFSDTDTISRTSENEFTIILIQTEESIAYERAEEINKEFINVFESINISLVFSVVEIQNNEEDVKLVLEKAYNHSLLKKMIDERSSSHNIISLLMESLIKYSGETKEHCFRVKEYAVQVGKALGLSSYELSKLEIAALIHDIGKIGVPDSILFGKKVISEEEKELVQMHSEIGYQIAITMQGLDQIAVDILQHHESYDGTGYPNGLKGDEISLNARIISIADSFDTMVNKGVYSNLKTKEEAVKELLNTGKYDQKIVEEFIKILDKEQE